MRDWEEQRELFPTRRRVEKTAPARPRIRPNIFAKMARVCTMHPLVVAASVLFLIAAIVPFAVLNAKPDFKSPIAISVDRATQDANAGLDKEFPETATLIIVRISAEMAEPAKAAAKSLAAAFEADRSNISQAFIPGVGPFYDRFGIYYLSTPDIEARVNNARQLNPLFQALALSPDLSGLSALIAQISAAVQNGRSPQGLGNFFKQISETLQSQTAGKPTPLDWRKVAGLAIENTTREWAVIVKPQPGRLVQARKTIEALVASVQQSQQGIKAAADFPDTSADESKASTARQAVVGVAVVVLLTGILLGFGLQSLRSVILVTTPIFVGCVVGLLLASLTTTDIDRVILTFVPATLFSTSAFAICMASALTRPRLKTASVVSFNMLAGQDIGPLVLTVCCVAVAMSAPWFLVSVSSFTFFALITTCSIVAGLIATCTVVPSFAAILPNRSVEQPAQSRSTEFVAGWRRLRPLLSILMISACLFCIVFFSSLRFGGSAAPDVTKGVQFIAADEEQARKLNEQLAAIPEVGVVRWLGTFLPLDVAQKQKVLKTLSGALEVSRAGGEAGPHVPAALLDNIQIGLRTIADQAGTDEVLRANANELRRSLAILANTSSSVEAATIEFENLVFSRFNDLPKQAEELASLPNPQVSDIDPNLRKLFVSDNGKWRLEALPKRILAPAMFIESLKRAGVQPVGSLVNAQAKLKSLEDSLILPLLIGLALSLAAALLYLRNLFTWLITVVAALLPIPLMAALAVTTGTVIEPLALPALIIAITASIVMAILSISRKQHLQISLTAIFLPVALLFAILIPLQILGITELQSFSRALTAFLICVTLSNLVVVQQLCTWSAVAKKSRPRLRKQRVTAESEEYLGNDVL
jgi:uncharacterized protein